MSVVIGTNRIIAFGIGIISTIGWWYSTILMTQRKVKVKRRHYIGLSLAIVGYIIWFFQFNYTVQTH